MKSVNVIRGVAAPMFEANVDTDVIIPSREMKQVSKTGLSKGLFAGRRYMNFETREINPSFVLNQPEFSSAVILLTDQNFGCGSSREHAVWALLEYGIQAIIAPSFGSIFYKNCINNGLLPATMDRSTVMNLVKQSGSEFAISLSNQTITVAGQFSVTFDINESDKKLLMAGLDPIDQALTYSKEIEAFETARQTSHPWLVL